ncbi:hypothetical protein Dvina_19365 [Dactylosporangium vinaceum]|uniref:Uncharacterized protein n=1 Tax=Dactylosporangium vinaceum TaxID=53362 RepID=A0ABV5M9H3_9ACTN|nr:hypothetical protein [Dactylosporangium vinaceum]UAC00022.1 hypothetical protein Dvina_19365 [Dactylosporangium vinaceum]
MSEDNGLPTMPGTADADEDAAGVKAPRVPNAPLTEATRPVPDAPPVTEPETPPTVGRSTQYPGRAVGDRRAARPVRTASGPGYAVQP